MKLKFTEFAYAQLREIHEYYTNNGYERYADKLRSKILESAQRFIEMPEIGRRFPVDYSPYEHRFWTVDSYRMFYKIEPDNDRILVVYFFNTRQDPLKMPAEFPD